MNKANMAQQHTSAGFLSPNQGILQRKCACGGHTTADKECAECAKKKNALQRKLTIGTSNDPLELEADRVADQVLAKQPNPIVSKTPPRIQRYAGQAARQADTSALASVHQTLAGPGSPLTQAIQHDMGQRFGHDFSSVRVHTDAKATESARSVSALAYTVGRDIVFQSDHYKPELTEGKRLLAHELTHVVQQTGGAPVPTKSSDKAPSATNEGNYKITHVGQSSTDVIQRAGDPAFLPTPFACPHDLAPGRPAGTDILFSVGGFTITPAHTVQLTTVRDSWRTAGGTEDVLVHGYASTQGEQEPNWTLSCNRAEAVKTELVRLGIPAVRVNVVAHGESTDFSASNAPNQHAVVSTSPGGILPLAAGVLTPRDNFARRSLTRFGVGEVVDLSFLSLPARPAADFGGLEWHLAAGVGALTGVTNIGTGTYTAPAAAGNARLELRVAAGATAGRVISTHLITIVIPIRVNMTAVAGSAPTFGGWGNPPIAVGTWGAGFRANVFVDPKNVSFQGVVFNEGTATGVVTGSFLSSRAGLVHPVSVFGAGRGGNATTGTPVGPAGTQDGIWTWGGVSPTTILGMQFCGVSSFVWPIPWQFSVSGGARTGFAGGFTANHRIRSNISCHATIDKAGAGPFCRRMNGTTC